MALCVMCVGKLEGLHVCDYCMSVLVSFCLKRFVHVQYITLPLHTM